MISPETIAADFIERIERELSSLKFRCPTIIDKSSAVNDELEVRFIMLDEGLEPEQDFEIFVNSIDVSAIAKTLIRDIKVGDTLVNRMVIPEGDLICVFGKRLPLRILFAFNMQQYAWMGRLDYMRLKTGESK